MTSLLKNFSSKCSDFTGLLYFSLMATIYYAKWILLPSGEILQNGAISVEGCRIASIGSRSRIKRRSSDHIVNVGDLFLLPGLINMHIHLDEGVVRGIPKDPEETFASWITKKNSRLKQASPETQQTTIRLGARELLSHGITTVVDSSRTGVSASVLRNEPIRLCVIHEVHPDDAVQEEAVIKTLETRIALSDKSYCTGIGPYALFSLSPQRHREVIELASKKKLLWASHLAESSEELQAFSEQTGDLYFHITRKKEWPYGKTRGPMNTVLANDLVPDNAVLFHCNYVNGQELEQLAAKNVSIVQCFQYTSALGHKMFPLDVARNRGISLCVGTESIVYSESMDLLDELYLAKRSYPHIPAGEMIRWVTSNAAHALGAGDILGNLDEGKLADIIGVHIQHDIGDDLLEQLILGESEVRLVIVNGEEVIADY
jgi:cytosine/adenosine deaminase-related metal-dependent hydrolase